MRHCITFPPWRLSLQLSQQIRCPNTRSPCWRSPAPQDAQEQLELQILRARTCLVTPSSIIVQTEHKYFTSEGPLQGQQLSRLPETQRYSEGPHWPGHILLHHRFHLRKGQVSAHLYTQQQQVKPPETLQITVYEDGPTKARQRPFPFASEKQVKFIPSLPHHASLLIATSCDGTEDRITSGFEKAGLLCEVFARFSAGGTFSRLAFWSVRRERLSLYILLGIVNNISEYHYEVNKVKLQMTKFKYKKLEQKKPHA